MKTKYLIRSFKHFGKDKTCEKSRSMSTLGARGISCAVSGVGHVSIVTRPSAAEVSTAREKNPLVPRVQHETFPHKM